jgi:transposase
VKPICTCHQVFQSTYLFGAFSPITGKHLLMQLPLCNAETFQIFLDELSAQEPDLFKILVLDNGAFHKAKSLKIPQNIALIFLPPYSPELNPAEKIWAAIKRMFTNKFFNSMESLGIFLADAQRSLTKQSIISTCRIGYVLPCINWAI